MRCVKALGGGKTTKKKKVSDGPSWRSTSSAGAGRIMREIRSAVRIEKGEDACDERKIRMSVLFPRAIGDL